MFFPKPVDSENKEIQFKIHLVFADYEEEIYETNRSKFFNVKLKREYPRHLVNVFVSLYCTMKIVITNEKIQY